MSRPTLCPFERFMTVSIRRAVLAHVRIAMAAKRKADTSSPKRLWDDASLKSLVSPDESPVPYPGLRCQRRQVAVPMAQKSSLGSQKTGDFFSFPFF